MQVSKLSLDAILPTRATKYSAGIDLYSPISGTLEPFQRLLVPIDISIKLPEQTFVHILPRSGLALKSGIHIGAGVIDEDYRGNVGVILFNLSDKPYEFKKGDRIAQMVIKRYEKVDIEEVNVLDNTERGTSGFGSSGI